MITKCIACGSTKLVKVSKDGKVLKCKICGELMDDE
jgi:transcription elongation factor Elf1